MNPFLLALVAAIAGSAITWCVLHFAVGSSRSDGGGQLDLARPSVSTTDTRLYIERALADLRLGVVIFGSDGSEIYRNVVAQQFSTGRHGDAIVDAALQRVVDVTAAGRELQESVDLYGPPSKNLMVQASPIYDNGAVSGSVVVIDDVTETRHLDRVRSDFVANVSHELRTPIGALSVLAEAMQSATGDATRTRLTDRMVREAHRLSATIDDLLTLSRLESGPVAEPVTMDLASVVAMALERTAESASQRSILIEVDGHNAGPVLISGDQAQLVSAVSNLYDNALKYSDVGASIFVKIAISDDKGAVLTVTDTGPGIPEKDLGRVFERFYRVDSARSRNTGGTGLGLSIVKHAVTNHGGTVRVESQEGEGSTFTVRLPLSDAAARSTESRA